MNPNDLAWKGTTVEQKQQLLDYSLRERERLVKEGKVKDGQLGLASTCVDIIGTAKAALKDAECREAAKPGWRDLLKRATSLAEEAVKLAEQAGTDDWTPGEFEVAGATILRTADGDSAEIDHAVKLFDQGLDKARDQKDFSANILLFSQLVKSSIARGNVHSIDASIVRLQDMILSAKNTAETSDQTLDPRVMTRAYRSLAEGAKVLAIHYAKEAGSENQELKARNI